MNPGRKDHVYVGKKDGVKVYEQKRYLLWKIRDLHEITNGGSVIEEPGGDSFSNAFGRPLKFALLYDVLKLHKEYVFNRDIPQWSCLCELCQNVTLLATGVNKVLKDKLATSHHDIVEKFSCSSSRHCMHDACCEICSSIYINILDNMEIIESQNEGSTDNDDDYHDDQSDQPKTSVRLYKQDKSDEGKITKISWDLSVTDAIESLKQQIAVKKAPFQKTYPSIQVKDEVKDNLKQNDLLIHVDYSENYNNKQQWEIQSAYFGHVSFSIFTACCYFKDESNAINKDAITVTSETSDHSRSVCIVSAKSYSFRERKVHPSSAEIECNCLE